MDLIPKQLDTGSSGSKKSRKDIHELYEDRLSTLPKTAIETILVRLSLRESVRTSILSHDWRYEWHNLPVLVFNHVNFPLHQNQFQVAYDRKLVEAVDHVLLLHQGPITTFMLSTDLVRSINIDKWILFLSRRGVEEFILDKWMGERKLQLLDLENVLVPNNGLNSLISNCPLLRKLVLRHIDGSDHLKLCAPNLESFEIENSFEDVSFVVTPLLARVSLDMWSNGLYRSSAKGSTCKLAEILSCLSGIKRLVLVNHAYQTLSVGDIPASFPPTYQLSHLCLSINLEDTHHLLFARCMLKSSPLLRSLYIESISCESNWEIAVKEFWKAYDEFKCLFTHLQVLDARDYAGTESELKFIEIVLANAPVLEIVTIAVRKDVEMMGINVMEIKKTVFGFQRMSSKAEVIFEE